MARDPNEIAVEFKTAVADLESARRRLNVANTLAVTVRLGSELRTVSAGVVALAKAEIIADLQVAVDAAEAVCADLAAEAVEAFPK